MIDTFAALLFAHVMADFILQTTWMVANKRAPHVLLLHGVIVLITAIAAIGNIFAWEIYALAAAHLAIDGVKTYLLPDRLATFLADQTAHLATLLAVAFVAPNIVQNGFWADLPQLHVVFIFLAGLVVTIKAGGVAVAYLVAPWASIDGLPKGLPNGGMLIGMLERGLIFLLVFVGQPAGIGFLIAAKSVLRFDASSKDQRAGEYIIVGTLASFGWALVMAYVTLALLNMDSPLGIPVLRD